MNPRAHLDQARRYAVMAVLDVVLAAVVAFAQMIELPDTERQKGER